MAIVLTPTEQAIYDKAVTNVPADIFIPAAIDIANGDADADDIVVTNPSGLQQDIDAANESIIATDGRIVDLTNEVNLQTKVVTHYHTFLRGYEDEIQFYNGVKETTPWQLTEVGEATNIFKNINTRYFPAGHNTNPLTINSFAEETGTGATSVNPTNIIALLPPIKAALDYFRSTWTNFERTSNVTDDILDQPDFDADLLAIHTACDAFEPTLTAAINHLVPPFFDDENAGAPAAAAARKIELENSLAIVQAFNALTFYVDASTTIDDFLAEALLIPTEVTARISNINTNYRTSVFYNARKEFGIELADFGEGIIYKKLQEIAGRQSQVDRRDKLVRKLAVYNSAGL